MLLWLDQLVTIFDTTLVFIFLVMLIIALVGWHTGSFAVGTVGAFLTFFYFTVAITDGMLTNILYLALGVILLGTAAYSANIFVGGDDGAGA